MGGWRSRSARCAQMGAWEGEREITPVLPPGCRCVKRGYLRRAGEGKDLLQVCSHPLPCQTWINAEHRGPLCPPAGWPRGVPCVVVWPLPSSSSSSCGHVTIVSPCFGQACHRKTTSASALVPLHGKARLPCTCQLQLNVPVDPGHVFPLGFQKRGPRRDSSQMSSSGFFRGDVHLSIYSSLKISRAAIKANSEKTPGLYNPLNQASAWTHGCRGASLGFRRKMDQCRVFSPSWVCRKGSTKAGRKALLSVTPTKELGEQERNRSLDEHRYRQLFFFFPPCT